MFLSRFSSFIFYLYVSASVQCKNRLARDESFLAIPTMPWSVVQPEKVVRAPARYKTQSQPWPPTAEMPP